MSVCMYEHVSARRRNNLQEKPVKSGRKMHLGRRGAS